MEGGRALLFESDRRVKLFAFMVIFVKTITWALIFTLSWKLYTIMPPDTNLLNKLLYLTGILLLLGVFFFNIYLFWPRPTSKLSPFLPFVYRVVLLPEGLQIYSSFTGKPWEVKFANIVFLTSAGHVVHRGEDGIPLDKVRDQEWHRLMAEIEERPEGKYVRLNLPLLQGGKDLLEMVRQRAQGAVYIDLGKPGEEETAGKC